MVNKIYKNSLFFLLINQVYGKCSNYKKIENNKIETKDQKKKDEEKKEEIKKTPKPKTAKNRLEKDVYDKVDINEIDPTKNDDEVLKQIFSIKDLTLYDCIIQIRNLYSILKKNKFEKKDLQFSFVNNIVGDEIKTNNTYKGSINGEIKKALIDGFTEKAKDFNDEITNYCNSNQSKFFENIKDIDSIPIEKFIENRLGVHKNTNITLEYSENDLKTLLTNLYKDMTKYFTKKGAYSLIDKIILLYCNGFIDKFKATNNRKYYITSSHIEHSEDSNLFHNEGSSDGIVFSKDGDFYSFREKKECDEDCISCAINKLLGKMGCNLYDFIFLQQVKESNIDTSCYLKIYFNEKLRNGIKETNISLEDASDTIITTIPDTIEIFCAKFPKEYFFEILDINWALTYLLLKFCNFFGESDKIELYREMNFDKNSHILEKVGKRNINDTFVSTSISSPVFRNYKAGRYDYFYKINCEKYLCIFNYFLSSIGKSLLSDHEQEFGLLSVNKNFERMFKDNNNDIGLNLPENIKTKLNEEIAKISGTDEWETNAFKESFKGNAYVNLKKWQYLKDLKNDKDALDVYTKYINTHKKKDEPEKNIETEIQNTLKIPYFTSGFKKETLDLSEIVK